MPDKPRRRIEVTLKIGADSWEDVYAALRNTAFCVDRGELRGTSVSGGYSWGHIWEVDEDESITHDSWYSDLTAYLEAERAKEEAAAGGGE